MSPVVKKKGEKFTLPSKYLLFILTILCILLMVLTFTTSALSMPLSYLAGSIVIPFEEGIAKLGGYLNEKMEMLQDIEDLIAEKTPRVHKIIRKTYDRIGLPISKYITTKRRSNIVYFIMKPLEWLFVLVLYTFDTKPENRINSQYTGK